MLCKFSKANTNVVELSQYRNVTKFTNTINSNLIQFFATNFISIYFHSIMEVEKLRCISNRNYLVINLSCLYWAMEIAANVRSSRNGTNAFQSPEII